MKLPKIKISDKLKSRKFLLALGYGVLVALNRGLELELTDAELEKILGAVVMFILAEGSADIVTRFKK